MVVMSTITLLGALGQSYCQKIKTWDNAFWVDGEEGAQLEGTPPTELRRIANIPLHKYTQHSHSHKKESTATKVKFI